MPLIYGSKFDTIKIPAGDVGSYKYYSAYVAPDTSDALSLFFTIFLSAIELAIGATGIGGIATSVLGVGFAGARAGATSAITGRDFDWKSFSIDAATPIATALTGGAIKGVKGIVAGREIATLRDSISTAKNALETSDGAWISKAENARFWSDLDTDRLFTKTETYGKLDYVQQSKMTAYDTSRDYLENLDNSLGKLKETSVFDRASQLKNLKGQLNEEFINGYGLDNTQSVTHLNDVFYGHKSVLSNQFNIISSEKDIAENAIAKAVENAATNVFKVDLNVLTWGSLTGSKVLTETVTHGITRALEEGADAAIRTVLGNADKHIVDDAISFVEEAFRIGKSVSIIAEELSARLARYGLNISFDIARAFVELVAVRAGIVGAITKLGFRGVKGWVKLNKSELVSLHTAHEFVKNIEQLGDFATDIPKSMISKLTAKLAKWTNKNMEKFFDKLKGVFGRVKGAFKKAKALEKAFERTGGVRIDSDVILGYKIIGHEGPFYQIQISFKPDATGAKDPQAKNYGGKKPVYVTASMLQIVKLQQGGMAYYLDTWAISRGGKSASLGALNGFFNALPIAGAVGAAYAPVAFLTKVVGIVNTVVRTIARYKAHGVSDQFSGWWTDTKGKGLAAGKAGFGRIIGAVLGGGVLGRMVGGELSKLAFNSAMGEKTDVLNDTVKKVAVKAHSKAPKNVKAATTQMRLSKRLRGTYKSFSARR